MKKTSFKACYDNNYKINNNNNNGEKNCVKVSLKMVLKHIVVDNDNLARK